MAAALSYGKRCLKAVLKKFDDNGKKRKPDEEMLEYCKAGIDKDGFTVQFISDYKGFGVFVKQEHFKGDFLLEYVGERLSEEEGERRERKYPENKMYYYTHNGKKLCIDASATQDHICQYVNDGTKNQVNSVMKLKVVRNIPRLCLYALSNIRPGEELLYDYGDGRNLWWRNKLAQSDPCMNDADTDDDPFDVGKISDISSSDDSYVCDSVGSEGGLSEIIINISQFDETTPVPIVASHQMDDLMESEKCNETTPVTVVANHQMDDSMKSEKCDETTSVTIVANHLMDDSMKSEKCDETIPVPIVAYHQMDNSMESEKCDETIPVPIVAYLQMDNSMESEKCDETIPVQIVAYHQMDNSMESEKCDQTTPVTIVANNPMDDTMESEKCDETTPVLIVANHQMDDLMESEKCDETTPVPIVAYHQMDDLMESEKLTPDVNSKKLRPGRMCIFCNKVIHGGKIKRHILTHKTSHEEVANILKKSSVEQNKWFEQKRIEGMYDYNTKFNTAGGDTYMRQRKPKKPDNIRMCVNCKKFISNRTFYKHKTKCGESSEPIKPLLLKPSVIHKDSEFVSSILNKFRDGEVGSLIRQDKTIQIIGYKHFLCRKSECSKTNAIRKEVMMEMREIARLYLCFKEFCEDEVTVEDMFTRKKLPELKEAIKGLCQSDSGDKHGLKLNLTGIFQRCIKILIGYYAESCQDMKQKELKKFQAAFNFSLAEIIGKSRNQANKNSLKKARLPKNLPEADDMAKLGVFINSEIEHCVKNFTSHEYTWLRSLVVARVTLYNARRGEEGSRLLVEEWQDAMNQVWVPPEIIDSIEDDAERFLAGQFRLAYMSGKGKKYVPLLIPVDLIEAVEILLSHRKQFGISEDNIFLFATKSSCAHCSGWHAVSSVCAAAGVSVNATKNRHRASTVYAALDMNESDRRIFFDHLGHEETINKENYQCPPGLQEIRVMGKFLNTLEGGSSETEQIRLPQKGCDQESTSKAESEGCSTDNEQNACTPKKRKKKLVSFRWSQDMTARVMKDFQCWIERDRGNPLPSKKELEKYLKKNDVRCTLFQLRTKIMNEQNKRRNSISKKISMFQN